MYGLKIYYSVHSVFLFLLTSILFFSCAQIVAPGGGKKDTTPPRVVKYTPDSAQTNFNSKSIQITFDEFVQLKDLNNQLIISPPLKNTPEITIKNKSLNIVFSKKDTLKQNTTYCISFGNAIQDITENNPKENFKYIFSTGSFIDSLVLNGKVENGFNHSTEKGLLVLLYDNFDDSVVYKHLPDYFSKTKEDGTFQINNIKEGKYKLVVIKDANSNYKYDGESESIGFIEIPIDIKEKKKILIDLFQETPKKLYLKKATYDTYGKIVFVFNKSADSLQVQPINFTFKDNDVLLDYSKNRDTLNYWFRNIDKDILKLRLLNGTKVMDTLEYKLITKDEALKSKKHPLKLNLINNFNGNQSFDLNNEIKLVFNHPIDKIKDSVKIILKEDSVLIKNITEYNYHKYYYNQISIERQGKLDSTNIEDLNNPGTTFIAPVQRFELFAPSKENTKYHLFIPPGTFTDFFGITNDTIKIDFKTKDEKYYGTVKLKVTLPEENKKYILQLLDDKENVIQEDFLSGSETINYKFLHPQQYKLKLIYDDNKNGKWDTGNYIKKIQPEKVIYYDGVINIRSNWDLDLEWKVTENK